MKLQIILIVLLAIFFVYALRARNQSPLARLIVAAFIGILMVLALFPGISSEAATLLGIGRGVDLLFYIAHLLAIFVGFRFYLKFRENEDRLVRLARKVALYEARRDENPGEEK